MQHDSSADEPWWGYKRDLAATYKRGRQLGRGGNASVVAVQHREYGQDFACKVLPKALNDAGLSAARRAMHPQIVRNEVQSPACLPLPKGPIISHPAAWGLKQNTQCMHVAKVEALQRLRGTLSVAALEDVFEDERHIYLIVELCRGGDLIHHLKSQPFDEQRVRACITPLHERLHERFKLTFFFSQTPIPRLLSHSAQVAAYMQSVLRAIAQCHAMCLLHRDVKPGEAYLCGEGLPRTAPRNCCFREALSGSDSGLHAQRRELHAVRAREGCPREGHRLWQRAAL